MGFYRCLGLITKEKNSNSSVQKVGGCHLNLVIKISITPQGKINTMCLWMGYTEKDTLSLMWFPCHPMYNLNLAMKKQYTFCEIIVCIIQSVEVMKVEVQLRNSSRLN